MNSDQLRQNVTVFGPIFPEPVQIILTVPLGNSVKLVGKGLKTKTVYKPILTLEQISQLQASPAQNPFDADPSRFRLGVEAMRLGLAYEYDLAPDGILAMNSHPLCSPFQLRSATFANQIGVSPTCPTYGKTADNTSNELILPDPQVAAGNYVPRVCCSTQQLAPNRGSLQTLPLVLRWRSGVLRCAYSKLDSGIKNTT